MNQKDTQFQLLNSPIGTPYFKGKKTLSSPNILQQGNQKKGNIANQLILKDKSSLLPIQLCSIKQMYKIINHKNRSGISQYKPPRYQSEEKDLIIDIKKQGLRRNKTQLSNHSKAIFNVKSTKRTDMSKFNLLTQYIKSKQNEKKKAPGPGQYDLRSKSHTISFNIKRQAKRISYLNILQSNAKKYRSPSPSQYNIMGQFDLKRSFQKNVTANKLCLSNQNNLRKQGRFYRASYLDNVFTLASQTPGVGQYVNLDQNQMINSNSLGKSRQKNPSWYFQNETAIKNRYTDQQQFEKIQNSRKVGNPSPAQYRPNPQINLFSNFPAKAKLKINQSRQMKQTKINSKKKLAKNKQNIGPGEYMGLCQWQPQGQHRVFNQFKFLHKGNAKSVYYS